ncbi:MAG TPA: hypothetical protein VF576_04100 [Rubricoccaceae bacterium]|jgi:hypothetical protein
MIRLLLTLLFASAASAQAPDSVAARRPVRADLVLGGVAGGVAAVLLTDTVVGAVSGRDDIGWSALAYPVGSAAGVHVVARLQGLDGALGDNVHETLRGVLIGGIGGGLVAAAGLALAGGPFGGGDEGAGGAILLAGVALAALAPPYLAARAYHVPSVEPVVFRGPDGQRVAGLAFHVAF